MGGVRRLLCEMRLAGTGAAVDDAAAFEAAGYDDLEYLCLVAGLPDEERDRRIDNIAQSVQLKPGHKNKFRSMLPGVVASLQAGWP